MKKGIGYTRISTKDQSHFSLDGQQRHIQEYADRNEIEILAIFKDDGQSAKSFDRPDWKNLEEFVKQHHNNIDMLIVAKFDRFSRNLREALNMIETLETKYGILVVSVFEQIGLHPKNPHYFEYRTHSLLSAHTELLRIRERTKMGIRQANLTGQWVNKPPYGYEKTKTDTGKRTLQINAAKSITIQKVFELFLQGVSYKEIGLYIKRTGFKQRHRSFIQRLLQNHAYAGYIKISEFYDEPARLIRALHPAIIDENIFWKVQEMMNPKALQKSIVNEDFPLRGVLKCHPCNKNLTAAFSKGKTKRIPYYFCIKDRKYNFNANKVHQAFDELLNELSLPPEYLEYVKERTYELLKLELRNRETLLAEKKKELLAMDARISALQISYLDKVFSVADYKKLHDQLVKEKAVLQIYISEISAPLEKIWHTYNTQLHKLANMRLLYHSADIHQKHAFVRLVFEGGLTYFDGSFRTQHLCNVFAINAAPLLEKKLLIIEQTQHILAGNEGSTPDGTPFEPIHHLLSLISHIKTA